MDAYREVLQVTIRDICTFTVAKSMLQLSRVHTMLSIQTNLQQYRWEVMAGCARSAEIALQSSRVLRTVFVRLGFLMNRKERALAMLLYLGYHIS
jgi:hypothetical protein